MRKAPLLLVVLLGLGVASAEEKVQKEQGTARARFAWEKWSGDFSSEKAALSRMIEGPGVGTVELDSTNAAIWVGYDPERTQASAILNHFKSTARYDAAKLTSLVSCFDGPFGTIRATATLKAAASKNAKQHGELAVLIEGAPGHTVLLDDPHRRGGRWHPGLTVKAPAEIEMDKKGKDGRSGSAQTYVHGFTGKKGAADATISVTINLVDKPKDPKEKETLHAVELSVPVTGP